MPCPQGQNWLLSQETHTHTHNYNAEQSKEGAKERIPPNWCLGEEDLARGVGGQGAGAFTSSCGWRCKEACGEEEEETESAWQLIQCGSKNKGGIAGALSKGRMGAPKLGSPGSVVRALQRETTPSSCLCLCFSC